MFLGFKSSSMHLDKIFYLLKLEPCRKYVFVSGSTEVCNDGNSQTRQWHRSCYHDAVNDSVAIKGMFSLDGLKPLPNAYV